jgi:hypothetical protein
LHGELYKFAHKILLFTIRSFRIYLFLTESLCVSQSIKGETLLFFIFSGRFSTTCLISLPSDSTVSIEPRTVVTLALAARRSNHSTSSHPLSARSHPLIG